MSQISQLSIDVPIKSPADKFYGFFRHKLQQLVQMFPLQLLSIEFLEGNDFIAGSLIQGSCNIGKPYINVGPTTVKIRVLVVDEINKSITYEAVEGDILSLYSLFKVKFQVSNNGILGGAIVNWLLEFEKVNENVPSPKPYIDFISAVVTVGVDAYLLTNQLIN